MGEFDDIDLDGEMPDFDEIDMPEIDGEFDVADVEVPELTTSKFQNLMENSISPMSKYQNLTTLTLMEKCQISTKLICLKSMANSILLMSKYQNLMISKSQISMVNSISLMLKYQNLTTLILMEKCQTST